MRSDQFLLARSLEPRLLKLTISREHCDTYAETSIVPCISTADARVQDTADHIDLKQQDLPRAEDVPRALDSCGDPSTGSP